MESKQLGSIRARVARSAEIELDDQTNAELLSAAHAESDKALRGPMEPFGVLWNPRSPMTNTLLHILYSILALPFLIN